MLSDRHPLEYKSPDPPRKNRLMQLVLLSVVVITPLPLLCLLGLEFMLEPPEPGNGYVLDDQTQRAVAVIIVLLAVIWCLAFFHLLRRWFRTRRQKA